MERTIKALLLFLFFLFPSVVFAEGNGEYHSDAYAYGFMLGMANDDMLPAQKVIARDMANNHMSELSRELFQDENRGFTQLTCYILAKDRDDKIYLYEVEADIYSSFDGSIKVYQEDGQLTNDVQYRKGLPMLRKWSRLLTIDTWFTGSAPLIAGSII